MSWHVKDNIVTRISWWQTVPDVTDLTVIQIRQTPIRRARVLPMSFIQDYFEIVFFAIATAIAVAAIAAIYYV